MKVLDAERHPWLRVPDVLAMVAISVIGVVTNVVAVTESYTNLYYFAVLNGLHGWRAALAPGVVDTFIVTGELLMFVALTRSWPKQVFRLGLSLAVAGFGVSLAGNIGHAHSAGWQARLMFALFPTAAAAGLAAGLTCIKLVTLSYNQDKTAPVQTAPVYKATLAPAPAEVPDRMAQTTQPGPPLVPSATVAAPVQAAASNKAKGRKTQPSPALAGLLDTPPGEVMDAIKAGAAAETIAAQFPGITLYRAKQLVGQHHSASNGTNLEGAR